MDVSTQTNARQELSHNLYDLLMENKNQRADDYYKNNPQSFYKL